jgi:hypothetical protein
LSGRTRVCGREGREARGVDSIRFDSLLRVQYSRHPDLVHCFTSRVRPEWMQRHYSISQCFDCYSLRVEPDYNRFETVHLVTLHYTTLHYTTLHYTTLHSRRSYGTSKTKKPQPVTAQRIHHEPTKHSATYRISLSSTTTMIRLHGNRFSLRAVIIVRGVYTYVVKDEHAKIEARNKCQNLVPAECSMQMETNFVTGAYFSISHPTFIDLCNICNR